MAKSTPRAISRSGSRELGRGDTLLLPPKAKYGVAISWESVGEDVDLDLQAVVVNQKGHIIDAVYHNNPIILRASVAHYGAGSDGLFEEERLDELIWVELARVPEYVRLIVFVVGTYTGCMSDAINTRVHIIDDLMQNEIAYFKMRRTTADVGVVATLEKRPSDDAESAWRLCKYESFAKKGRHFMDIIEPTLGDLIRQSIPDAPREQKVAFAMEKGQVLHIPHAAKTKWVFVSLVWDLSPQFVGPAFADLRISAVLFDSNGSELGAVDEESGEIKGVRHSGNGLTGAGIAADLEFIPEEVVQVFMLGNLHSGKETLESVSNPFCRVVDSKGTELATCDLNLDQIKPGLIVARIFREPGELSWAVQIMGAKSVPDIKMIFGKAPCEFRAWGPGPQDPCARRPRAPEVPEDDDPRPPDADGVKRNWRDVIDFREHGCAEEDLSFNL